jgi:outer membrane protein X
MANGAFAQKALKGEKGVSSVGVIGGYAVDNKAGLAGLDFRYNIGDRIRLAPSILYVFNSGDSLEKKNTLYFNADVHYLIRMTDKFTIYPVAGLGLAIWSLDRNYDVMDDEGNIYEDDELPEAYKKSHLHLGLNIGLGCEYRLTKDFIIGAEFKYNLTDQSAFNQAMFLGRIAYYY